MSEHIDLLTYLKSKLNTELANNSDSPAAQSIHRLVSDAESISDEHFNQLAPSPPHAPKLMLAAQALRGRNCIARKLLLSLLAAALQP
jgi:hypothetical protein